MFAGSVITVYPADDDAALYLYHLIVQKYGWGWMDKYMATKQNFIQGHLPVARSVASGENIAIFDASSSVWPFKREGKLEIVWSPVDETPVFTLTGGIFKDAPHPNAAKLYLTWFLAREQQSRLGSFSSRVDVQPPEGLQPLASRRPCVHHYGKGLPSRGSSAALLKETDQPHLDISRMGDRNNDPPNFSWRRRASQTSLDRQATKGLIVCWPSARS